MNRKQEAIAKPFFHIKWPKAHCIECRRALAVGEAVRRLDLDFWCLTCTQPLAESNVGLEYLPALPPTVQPTVIALLTEIRDLLRDRLAGDV